MDSKGPRPAAADKIIRHLPQVSFILTFAFLYIPIGAIILFSLSDSRLFGQWGGLTFKWYKKLFENVLILESLKVSLIVAGASALLSTLLGTLFTFARERLSGRKHRSGLLEIGLIAVLLSPEIIFGVSLLIFFGFLNIALGFTALILAHTLTNLPLAWLIISARLKSIAKELEEAAMDLGASYSMALRKITLPLLAPAMLASALVTFSYSFDCFVVSFFLAGPGTTTLPLRTYSLLRGGPTPEINALSTLLFVLPLILVGTAAITLFKPQKNMGRAAHAQDQAAR